VPRPPSADVHLQAANSSEKQSGVAELLNEGAPGASARCNQDAIKRLSKDRLYSRAAWTDVVQALASVCLVIITLLYTWFTGQQTRASQTSADASRVSAQAALKAANVAEQGLAESRKQGTSSEGQFHTQLDRINKSLRAANRTADASNQLAVTSREALQQAKRTADASIKLSDSTTFEARQMKRSAEAANKLATASANLATTSAGALAQSRQGLVAADKRFSEQERPYVLLVVVKIIASPTKTKITATANVTNSGRSPALNTGVTLSLIPGTNRDLAINAFFRGPQFSRAALSRSVVPPATPGDLTRSLNAEVSLSPDQVDALLSTDYGVTVVGRVEYADYSGRPYRTDVCFSRLADSTIVYCKNHNEIDPAHGG